MIEKLPLLISGIALLVSVLTAWITLFRRGSLGMTQPTIVYFGPDGSRSVQDEYLPKVFLRTLLFSTGKKGQMIESMHLKVIRNETVQNFSVWVYGEERLQRGSGLFVGESGVVANHHFLMPKDGETFKFVSGSYLVELYARTLGSRRDRLLWSQELIINPDQEKKMSELKAGVYFDWGPDSKKYLSHVEVKPPIPSPEEFLNILNPPAKLQSDD